MNQLSILDCLETRKTFKGLGDTDAPEKSNQENHAVIQSIIEKAGNAPFHFPSHKSHHEEQAGNEPWRVFVCDATNCRKLMQQLINEGDGTKIPNMLAACDYLFQVTWLPDPSNQQDESSKTDLFEPTMRNMEQNPGKWGNFCKSYRGKH